MPNRPVNRPVETDIETKIWRSLAQERNSRGITQAYAADALSISQPSLSQLERNGVGHCFQRMRDYCVLVLRSSIVIELPGGIKLKPLGATSELTGVNLNGSYEESGYDR